MFNEISQLVIIVLNFVLCAILFFADISQCCFLNFLMQKSVYLL